MLFLIMSWLFVLIFFVLIGPYYLKRRRNIKDKRNWLFANGRNKYFIAIDISIIVIFFTSLFFLANVYHSFDFSPYVVTGLLFLLSTNQGIEEWIFHREEKVYYHRLLASIVFLILMFLPLIGNQLSFV